MKLTPESLELNLPKLERRLVDFIRGYIEKVGAEGVVIGMSGGLDSSTAAALCAKAVGGGRTLGLILPERETWSEVDIDHAKAVAEKFNMPHALVDITPIVQSFYGSIPIYDSADRVSNGNVKARVRMIVLYYYANKLNRLVVGSSDKSEVMLGYFTKWGDYCADISPLTCLFKTQVRLLSEHLGLPKEITAKPPSPSLWPGHLAEEELGLGYDKLDLILYGLEHGMPLEEIARQLQLNIEAVRDVERRSREGEHKRKPPLSANPWEKTDLHSRFTNTLKYWAHHASTQK